MTAFEGGDAAGASFSGQMALNAYALLDSLDADAHFHVGLLHQITENHQAILARIDSIEGLVPNHLFASLLRHRVGRMTQDAGLMNQAYREFLQRYAVEISAERWEYDAHGRLVDNFKAEAEEAVNRDPSNNGF
jgi:hypothetical protein